MRRDKLGQALREDALGTRWPTAEACTRVNVEHHGQATERQIRYGTSVARMHPAGATIADRTLSSDAFGRRNDHNRLIR
jgi:hypothetical protein